MDKNKVFKTTGDKLKYLRKITGATLAEIGGDKLSKAIVCNIEHNRRQLNLKEANYIAKIINSKAQKRKLELNINVTGKWLMADLNQQIDICVKEFISKLEYKLNQQEYEYAKKELNEIKRNGDISDAQSYVIYNICAKWFMKRNFNVAKEYLLRMYELASKKGDINKQIYVLKQLTNVCMFLKDYKEVIIWRNLANTYCVKKYIPNFVRDIEFNKALALHALKNFKECKESLECLKKFTLGIKESVDVQLLKAECEKELTNLDLSENILINLLKINMDDVYRKANIYSHMAEIKYLKGNNAAIEYINRALAVKLEQDLKFKFVENEIAYNALRIYIKFNVNQVAEMFEKICYISKTIKNYNIYIKAVTELYEYYSQNNNMGALKSLLIELENLQYKNDKIIVLYYKILKVLYKTQDNVCKNELIEKGFKIL